VPGNWCRGTGAGELAAAARRACAVPVHSVPVWDSQMPGGHETWACGLAIHRLCGRNCAWRSGNLPCTGDKQQMSCGRQKNLEDISERPLCAGAVGSRNLSPLKAGSAPRGNPRERWKSWETGADGGNLTPVAASGTRRPSNRKVRAASQGEAPPSHTWRGLVALAARACGTCWPASRHREPTNIGCDGQTRSLVLKGSNRGTAIALGTRAQGRWRVWRVAVRSRCETWR